MAISRTDQCMRPKICQLFLPFKVMGGHNGKLWAGIALSAQNSLPQCSDIFRHRSPYWWRKITPLEWPLKPFSGPIFFSFRPFLQINTDQVWFYLRNVILVPLGGLWIRIYGSCWFRNTVYKWIRIYGSRGLGYTVCSISGLQNTVVVDYEIRFK